MRRVLRGPPEAGLALAVLACYGPVVPLAGQTLVGRVVDGREGKGLAGAAVVLVDDGLRRVTGAVTDSAGRFVLPAGEPGTYRVVVDPPGFASHLSRPLELRSEGYHEESFVIEPVPTARLGDAVREDEPYLTLLEDHLLSLCGKGFRADRHGVLVGVVVDERTGRTVPDALALAEWEGPAWPRPLTGPSPPVRIEIPVGESGSFVHCGLPADTEVRVRAQGAGRVGPVSSAVMSAGRVTRMDLPLPLGEAFSGKRPVGEGNILGRVVDYRTGEPVQAAEISVSGEERSAVTDVNGRFVMEGVPSGSRVLAVDHMAYPHQELLLPVKAGSGHDVSIRLVSEAIPLPPLVVTIRSTRWFRNMSGFTERARKGVGYFFLPEEVRRRAPGALVDLVRTVPGIRVGVAPAGRPPRITVRGRRCDPAVYVDRALWSGGDPFTALRGADLDAVEVYRGLTEVPTEFAGRGDGCGTVVVWTRKALVASN